jgi:hypothetical protein
MDEGMYEGMDEGMKEWMDEWMNEQSVKADINNTESLLSTYFR